MRISDWSSDVCSSDLRAYFDGMSNLLCSMRMRLDIHPFQEMGQRHIQAVQPIGGLIALMTVPVKHPTRGQKHVASIHRHLDAIHDGKGALAQIGIASGRERVCEHVEISGGTGR